MLPITRPITRPITQPITGGDLDDPVAALFALNEPGFDYDFSDTTTLFQDTTGTTPVTGVEQTVALILDKSRGLVLGSELFSNQAGTFDNTSGGATATYTSATQTVSVTVAGTLTSYPRLTIDLGLTVGRTYLVSGRIDGTRTGVFGIRLATLGSANDLNYNNSTGVFQGRVSAGATSIQFLHDGTVTGSRNIATLSVRELPGLHQQQSTAASRAVLRSRYNQILYSEDFSNAVWLADFSGTGVSATKTPNFGIAPDGTQTATRIQLNKGAGTTASDFARVYQSTAVDATTIRRIWIRTNDASTKTFRLSADGANFTVTGTWTQIADTGSNASLQILLQATTSTDADFLVWRPEAVRSTDAQIPYQRINAATDYATGPQWPTYLEYDGVDDSYASAANLDLSGTDKLTVFAAVTKLSDAAAAILLETSTDAASNPGTFWIAAPVSNGSANYEFRTRGTFDGVASYTNAAVAAPNTRVLTGTGDISGDSAILRANGVQVASSSADQGTGNFGSYPLFLGRRNNATLPFRGRMYRVIGRGAATPVGAIAAVEGALNVQVGKVY